LFDIKTIFNRLSSALEKGKKHFTRFYLNNTAINEIPELTFQDITFDEIFIDRGTNLSLIHTNAFNCLNLVLKHFIIGDTPLRNNDSNYDIFTAISEMVNIVSIDISNTSLTEIPDFAFRPINGSQLSLRYIHINYNMNLNKIGNNAFNNLSSLSVLNLDNNNLNHISENMFNMSNSESKLDLYLRSNLLNSSSFEMNAFSQLNRPTNLILYGNDITFIDQHIFEPFFRLHILNRIYYTRMGLDCNDCRSYWAFSNSKYNNQTTDIYCSNGHIFTDSNNFANCSTYK
jgi:hypothetical protein